jgi:hypothetical protein
MKVFILEVDLTNPTLRLKAGTPNNSTAFARQTMSDIARTQDTAGNRVLAAVNGDYFNLTTGVPSSAIYKNGYLLNRSIAPYVLSCQLMIRIKGLL